MFVRALLISLTTPMAVIYGCHEKSFGLKLHGMLMYFGHRTNGMGSRLSSLCQVCSKMAKTDKTVPESTKRFYNSTDKVLQDVSTYYIECS